MKLFLLALACVASACFADANEVSIHDVKIITPDGVFEEVKKEEMENGRVVRTETIQIKKPKMERERNIRPDREISAAKDLDKRRHLLDKFMEHFRMAKLLHGLLNSMPSESAMFEQPKHNPHHHRHRIFIVKLPLTSIPFPFPMDAFPSLNIPDQLFTAPHNHSTFTHADTVPLADQTPTTSEHSPDQSESSTKQPEPIDITTSSLQDQLPTPEISANQITDNEIES